MQPQPVPSPEDAEDRKQRKEQKRMKRTESEDLRTIKAAWNKFPEMYRHQMLGAAIMTSMIEKGEENADQAHLEGRN